MARDRCDNCGKDIPEGKKVVWEQKIDKIKYIFGYCSKKCHKEAPTNPNGIFYKLVKCIANPVVVKKYEPVAKPKAAEPVTESPVESPVVDEP